MTISNVDAQEFRGFGNYSLYYGNKNFKPAGILNEVEIGVDMAYCYFLKPQLSISYFSSEIKDESKYDHENNALETLSKRAYAINSSLGVKFYPNFDYYILPQLNVARIQAFGNYNSVDYYNVSNSLAFRERTQKWQISFGLEIGREFELSESSYNSINVSLNYNRLNLGKALNRLQYDNSNYHSNNFGLGVSFYFGLKKFERRTHP
jgi:hypothetical protein